LQSSFHSIPKIF